MKSVVQSIWNWFTGRDAAERQQYLEQRITDIKRECAALDWDIRAENRRAGDAQD